MNKFPPVFAVVLVLVTLALGAVFFTQKSESPKSSHDAVVMSATYALAMRDVTAEYRSNETQAAARVAEAKLLSLTVPAERRDFHLDLVLALHKFANVKASDAKAFAAAKAHVAELLDAATWLQ